LEYKAYSYKANQSNITEIFKDSKEGLQKLHDVKQSDYLGFHNCTFRNDLEINKTNLIKKISYNSILLGKNCCINPGVVAHSKLGSSIRFKKEDVIHKTYKEGFKKYLEGKEISRNNIRWGENISITSVKQNTFIDQNFPNYLIMKKLLFEE
jgi:hypothetical protein